MLPYAGSIGERASMKHDEKILRFSQELRKNMTKEERHLWYDFLKTYPVRFKRQFLIGNYIVDFYCHKAKLVIELDGSQHYSIPGKQADAVRDGYLREQGLTVLRYSNSDVDRNFPGVCGDILAHLQNC